MIKPLKLKSGKDVLTATNSYLAGKHLPTSVDLNKSQTEAELKLALAECLMDALQIATKARETATAIEQCLLHTGNFPVYLSDLTDASIHLRTLAVQYGTLWRLVRATDVRRVKKKPSLMRDGVGFDAEGSFTVSGPAGIVRESDLANEILETGESDGKSIKDWEE